MMMVKLHKNSLDWIDLSTDISEECALIRAEVGSSCRIPRGVNPVSRYEWKIGMLTYSKNVTTNLIASYPDRKSFEGPKMLVDSVFIASMY